MASYYFLGDLMTKHPFLKMEKMFIIQFHKREKMLIIQFHNTKKNFCYFHENFVMKKLAKTLVI